MNSLATWAMRSIAAAVLSPVLVLLTAVVVKVLFGLVRDAGVPALLVLVATYRLVPAPRAAAAPPAGKASART